MCLANSYRKNESVLSGRRVMRHLVIHSYSCGYLSPGAKSRLLHHGNEPAHTSLLVRNFLANNNNAFTRHGPLQPMKGRRFAITEEIDGLYKKCLSEVLRGFKKRRHNSLIFEGDYFEGDHMDIDE